MPELPEVQTIVNGLQKIIGDVIIGFWTDFPKAVRTTNFGKKIHDKKIERIFRSGKNIIIALGGDLFVIAHLKMTGQFLLEKHDNTDDREKYSKHVHHVFHLSSDKELEFSDIRKFGTLELVDKKKLEKFLSSKGLDPFSQEYSLKNFLSLIGRAKTKNVKQFLMEQSYISGIGNIYANEIPFDAKISPTKKVASLSDKEVRQLFLSIRYVLKKSLRFRGTSFSDYRDSSGKKGSFQDMLMVYKRYGQKCKRCGTIIQKNIVGQRSTFFCSRCQK